LRRQAADYGLALICLAVAVLIRWLLDPLLGNSLPYTPLGGAVAAAVWLCGFRPAIVVTLLGYVVCAYLFEQPRGSVIPSDAAGVTGLGAYLFTCALIIAIGEAMRRAQSRAGQRGEVLSVTLSSIGDAVITTNLDGNITYLNKVAEDLTGWSISEAKGKPLDQVFNIVNESTNEKVESPAVRALREGVVVGLANHTILIRKNGEACPIDDSAAPIRNEQGHVSGCVLIFRDVSEKRRLEKQVEDQLTAARLLASIVESSEDAIVSKTLDGTIRTWNDAAERLFGYTPEEAVGKHVSLIIPKERLAEEDEIIANLKAGHRIEHFETERLSKDGRLISVSLTISPIRDDTGKVTGASKIARDITERKTAEAERQKFVTLIENSTDFIGICDLNGVPFFVNRAGLDLVGLDDLESARKAPVREFFFPEDQEMIVNEFFPRVLKEGHGEVEVRFRNFKTGEARWMAYKVLTLKNDNGQPVAFATVSQDVTESRKLEDDLRKLAADLSEADRRKNEFLAMLAHELRNPLAPISNAATLLRSSQDPAAVTTASEMLQRQVGQMTRLIDDLLDMSRITQGKIELRPEPVDLARIIDQAVETVRPLVSAMKQQLNITQPAETVKVIADPARLTQVVGNLLNNASKFTDSGGQISLSVERRDDQARIAVKDNGIGIAADNIPLLFDMFSQIDSSLERSRGGLGIGLTLAKRLVEMTGGTIQAHSDGLGKGSEFVIELPLMSSDRMTAVNAGANGSTATASHRILVVDDNVDGAESLAMLLRLDGHETFIAHDGLEAIGIAEKVKPDAILLDIGLPSMNGYEVCQRIRQTAWGKNSVLIAVTGWGQKEDRDRSKEAGFDTHIVKPVDPDSLSGLLAKYLPGDNTG
jgi:PAS domain S-box-containing protein